jgi:hypothetical protein
MPYDCDGILIEMPETRAQACGSPARERGIEASRVRVQRTRLRGDLGGFVLFADTSERGLHQNTVRSGRLDGEEQVTGPMRSDVRAVCADHVFSCSQRTYSRALPSRSYTLTEKSWKFV